MKQRIGFFFFLAAFWLVYFQAVRIIFLFYHHEQSFDLIYWDWVRIAGHGMQLDISMTGYYLLIPGLILAVTPYFKPAYTLHIINFYNLVLLFVTSFIVISDLELYKHWGFRLDNTPLLYLGKPKEALASVDFRTILFHLVFALLIFVGFYRFYLAGNKYFHKIITTAGWPASAFFLLITASLILPIRGGTGVAPMNIGNVYFHENSFANHAAINVMFNLGYSLTNTEDRANPYICADVETMLNEVEQLEVTGEKETRKIITDGSPNVLMIILESFNAKIIGMQGGIKGVAQNLEKLIPEGVFFNNLYASGDRSDKGIVSILSGFPAMPRFSVIKYPQKTQYLPFISKDLAARGYKTAFYYGGDIDFANMRSYITNGGFQEMISKNDFHPSTYNSKWGVHDHVVFERLFNDLQSRDQPFFHVLFTLSSHEPFEVPVETAIPGSDPESRFMNAVHYTDQCLGHFIEKAKQTSWWKNTLLILVPDHGSRHPGYSHANDPARYRIPMLWLGGVVAEKNLIVEKVGSQTDIAKTLMRQLNLSDSRYEFGKDLLSPHSGSFAAFFYNDGFGWITDSSCFSFSNHDLEVSRFIEKPGAAEVFQARCYQQYCYGKFLELHD